MGVRTINSGIGTYRNAAGAWTHGVLGEEVEVNEDDLERFDRLNPDAPKVPAEVTDDSSSSDEPSVSQADVDAAALAVEAKAQEVVDAKAALDAERSAFEAEKAAFEASKAEAAKPSVPAASKSSSSPK